MKKILTIINYIVKVFFAIIGVTFLIGLFSDDVAEWSLPYQEKLEHKIAELSTQIDNATNPIEQVKQTLRLVELKKRKIYFDKTVERYSRADWVSILEDNGVDGAIEYLKIDANFEDFVKTDTVPNVRSFRWLHKALLDDLTKEQRYYLIHELYEFKSIMEENSSDRDKAREYLEKSLAIIKTDWTLYQYALFLAKDNNEKSIEIFKEAIALSKDKELLLEMEYNLAKSLVKFQQRDEAVKIYEKLLKSDRYKAQSLIALATLFNDHRAIEYFEKIDNSKFKNLDEEFKYMKAKENVAVIYLYNKQYEKSEKMLEEILEFYHDISTSNPETFIDIAKINRHLFSIYKELGMKGSQKESLKRAIFYYKALNKVYGNRYSSELEMLYKMQKELGK